MTNKLSERETQVLRLIADGHGNRAIGHLLYLSEDTVKTHAVRLFRKLNATGRAHAVARGYETGVLGSVPAVDAPDPVVVEPPTDRWAGAAMEKFKVEILREYRARRHEFSRITGASESGARALWRLADLHPQQFRALVLDEVARDEQRQDRGAA